MRVAAAVAGSTLATLLGVAAWHRTPPVVDLRQQVVAHLPKSGVEHPVTAVLLNFRGYDTLLEIAVLLVAVITGLAARRAQPDQSTTPRIDNGMLNALMHGVIPLMLLVAAYLLWAGAHRPGGAFQAGAVLAAAGVLLRLTGVVLPGAGPMAMRIALMAGFSVFLAVALGTLIANRPFLAYPVAWAGALILIIETALTLSIAAILLSLFAVAPPAPGRRRG